MPALLVFTMAAAGLAWMSYVLLVELPRHIAFLFSLKMRALLDHVERDLADDRLPDHPLSRELHHHMEYCLRFPRRISLARIWACKSPAPQVRFKERVRHARLPEQQEAVLLGHFDRFAKVLAGYITVGSPLAWTLLTAAMLGALCMMPIRGCRRLVAAFKRRSFETAADLPVIDRQHGRKRNRCVSDQVGVLVGSDSSFEDDECWHNGAAAA